MHYHRMRHFCLVMISMLLMLCNGIRDIEARKSTAHAKSGSTKNLTKAQLRRALHRTNRNKQIHTSKEKNSSSLSSASPITVDAILLPRILTLKTVLRISCTLLIIISCFQCIATVGIPHIQAIWQLLHQGTHSDIPIMPMDYKPSLADIQLSRFIAMSTRDLLPPIALPSIGPLLQLLASLLFLVSSTILIPRWSTAAKVFLEYRRIPIESATASKVIHALYNSKRKPSVLIRIIDEDLQASDDSTSASKDSIVQKSQLEISPLMTIEANDSDENDEDGSWEFAKHPTNTYFDWNQCRYYFDVVSGDCINGGPTLHKASFQSILNLLNDDNQVSSRRNRLAQERYLSYNQPTLSIPTIMEALSARLSSPLVVIQFVGRILSCLEEGSQAFVNLGMALLEHWYNARQAIVSTRQIASEVQENVQDTSSIRILKLTHKRDKKRWKSTTAGELVPGDIFVLPLKQGENLVVPVDALLLAGQSLANEAVLTGESVPQSKIPIDLHERVENDAAARLDLDADRNSILFAGTSLVHCSENPNHRSIQEIRFPKFDGDSDSPAVICMALRTGTYSSKGQLLRTLKSGSSHVGAISNAQSEKDAVRLIGGLSIFAALACASIFLDRGHGMTTKKVSSFRRIIQCTRILIAGIPSDMTLALSAVARSCSSQLREGSDVVCSEPGALLTAASVDTLVFDKTGTLTADTQAVSKLIRTLSKDHSVDATFQLAQLAGCHSLIHLDPIEENIQVVGDPLDKAALSYCGWRYNTTDQSYSNPENIQEPCSTVPYRLWQIKSFPFDPAKRMSTAIVVLERVDGTMQLLSFTKGSPDRIRQMYHKHLRSDSDFIQAYDQQVKDFEVQGYRSIALGWKDLTDSELCRDLFPDGLQKRDIALSMQGRTTLRRKDFESDDLNFGGFVEFDASIRPSSRRIIGELNTAGIQSIMLTGDAVDAAVAVAKKVGIVSCNQVRILELSTSHNKKKLQWRVVKLRRKKVDKSSVGRNPSEIIPFSASSLIDTLNLEHANKCAIAASGDALESIFQRDIDPVNQNLIENLARVSVIGRATPKQKKTVVNRLRTDCDRITMMCGDGVNDVAAMKTANVAVALLNGFGDETDLKSGKDFDDERRRKKLASEMIGSQRKNMNTDRHREKKASQQRISEKIEKAQAKIKARAALRSGVDIDSSDIKYEVQDVKELMSVNLEIVKAERQRQKRMKMGGGDAARILAEERRNASGEHGTSDNEITPTIKPGEASLVAPFSCLHPSIEGVDSVLRASVATAACALATQEMIAMHCLMACANLASLYRDGVRYGKNMNIAELMLGSLLNQQQYKVACIPRPRLPKSLSIRPSRSMFEHTTILRTFAQALVNLVSINSIVAYAKKMEAAINPISKFDLSLRGDHPQKISQILTAVAASTKGGRRSDFDESESQQASIFRRPPFRPNLETNAVFIFSVLQDSLVTLSIHRGKPFCRSFLENRSLCTSFVFNIGFCIACITELFPKVNAFLQLKALPNRQSRAIFLGIMVANIAASRFVAWALTPHQDGEVSVVNQRSIAEESAVDVEERLLVEESTQNKRNSFAAISFMIYLALESVLKKN